MFVRIAVLDPLPLFRHGVMAALWEAGLGSESPQDAFAWMNGGHRRLVVLGLHSADDWERLSQLCQAYDDVLVVALLPDDDVTTHVRALASGAVAALPRDAEPAAVREIVEDVIEGRTVLPVEVLRGLRSYGVAAKPDESLPNAREMEWLRRLSTGVTVAELADRAGYSERMMFRLLRELYKRMRVGNRTEALLLARERRWI
jgi:DNA-binding NarL/FixJ family response regulator